MTDEKRAGLSQRKLLDESAPRFLIACAFGNERLDAGEHGREPRFAGGNILKLGHYAIDGLTLLVDDPQHVEAHDVARSLPDSVDRHFAIQQRKASLLHIAVAAEALHGLTDQRGRRLAHPIFGGRGHQPPIGGFGSVLAAVESAGKPERKRGRCLDVECHVGKDLRHQRLIDQPLMAQVLADMTLDVEAATALAFRLARAFDGGEDASESAYRRLMTPATKYWVCKTAPALVGEAMECLGGNGYVEEGGFPLLYREVPVNAIWEGSGNVMCLDVLRVVDKEREAVDRVMAELEDVAAGESRLSAVLARIKALIAECARDQKAGRTLVEQLALAEAGALLIRHAPEAVSDGFLATRLNGPWRHTYGAGLARTDTGAILSRAAPRLV